MIRKIVSENLNPLISNYILSKNLYDDIVYALEIPPKNIDADLALNVAMSIAKKLKTNPKIIMDEIISLILKEMPDIIKSADGVGAFINLTLTDKFLFKELEKIIEQKDKYPQFDLKHKKKVLIEFVSANPTGPLHIGHGRGAAIGDSIARIFSHIGYEVKREYYVNDAGNQMSVLGDSLKIRYLQLKGENVVLPEGYYQGDYLKEIASQLISEGKKFEDINWMQEAGTSILNGIKKDLNDYDVFFKDDEYFSESAIAVKKDKDGKTETDKCCDNLVKKNFAYVKDDALWLKSSEFGDDKDRVLKRSDGRYTYLASDIAYHKNKIERDFDKLIDLFGADHHGYTARMKAAVDMLGFNRDNLQIILYQLVSLVRDGKPLAMSTRTGEFITLKELIGEVGKDGLRFSVLLTAPNSPIEFDIELAKKRTNDNPVFYVQYVNARCASIFKESLNKNLPQNFDLTLLKTKEERDLIKHLCLFYNALSVCERTLSPHHLPLYLIKLADYYHRFYEKTRVLTEDKNLSVARLKLLEAVVVIIKNGLSLIGVSTPNKM